MPIRTGLTYIVERQRDGTVLAFKRWYEPGNPNDENGHRQEPLDLRLDLENHSPTGFECGYEGSGPAQLALAIVADALEDDDRAVKVHQGYKFAVIARLGGVNDGPFKWETSATTVTRLVEKIERKGWHKVVEQFDRNRQFSPSHTGEQAFRRRQ
jgi:hypothetical protein